MEEKREMPEGTEQLTGTCIYCGQSMIIETVGVATQEQLDKWATEKCTCEQAKKAQEKVKAKRTAEDNIKFMFREHYPEVEAVMKEALTYIEDGALSKITIDTGTGVKGSLSSTSNDTIKVEMVTTNKKALEA